MGMAASQARYLGLAARRTNCEYEGQQINQARTALANQSANLFNQLLGLKVPTVPDSSNYTSLQYSFSDGYNNFEITNMQHIDDPDYNYVIKYRYFEDDIFGAEELNTNPQVVPTTEKVYTTVSSKIGGTTTSTSTSGLGANGDEYDVTLNGINYRYVPATNEEDYTALNRMSKDKGIDFNPGNTLKYVDAKGNVTYILKTDADKLAVPMADQIDAIKNTLYGTGGSITVPKPVSVMDTINGLLGSGQLTTAQENALKAFYDGTNGSLVTALEMPDSIDEEQLAKLQKLDELLGAEDKSTTPPTYTGLAKVLNDIQNAGNVTTETLETAMKKSLEDSINSAKENSKDVTTYSSNLTTKGTYYVGNSLATQYVKGENEVTDAALAQIAKDNPDSEIAKIVTGKGSGDIYIYQKRGITMFATEKEMLKAYEAADPNKTPNQVHSLKQYYSTTQTKEIVNESKALLDDASGTGRFNTIRLKNSTADFTLNSETATNQTAYNEAMQQYYYETAAYEKKIADINAQTEIIQQQDRTLELRLRQLDTEHNALQTEMDAVKKVISKNVEETFKTFSN